MSRCKSHNACAASLLLTTFACILGAAASVETSADTVAAPGHACAANESWDNSMNMCMPSARSAGAGATLISGQFNVFGVFSVLQGPRGVDQFAAPNMCMLDVGRAVTPRQFFNLDLMGTTELWTYPRRGYPELLQIGEEQSDGQPYVDAQHPHTSPIMGLTLSDTVSLASSRTLKLFFAPRGESTDGPIAFMHRDSARDDPDAPLGHHVGQDVGHISSTVLGAQLDLGQMILEASAFNGTEPNPTVVDLPLGSINSEALRVTYALSAEHRVMASVANVEQTDPQYPGTSSATRRSAALYDHFALTDLGLLDHTLVVGSITRHPTDSSLTSFLDEAVLQRGSSAVWGRIEVLQRLASELEIPTSPAPAGSVKHWVSAVTLGYTHWSSPYRNLQLGLGTSLTLDVVPGDWASAYGSRTPVTARLIVQLRGSGRNGS
jgi:hypothetical protein